MAKFFKRSAPLLSVLAFGCGSMLAGCGGGGDSGDGGSPDTAYAITADNSVTVARGGMAGLQAGQVAGTADDGLVGPVGLQSGAQHLGRARAMAVAQAAQTFPCPVSGSLTVTLVDGNGNGELDVKGESISLQSTSCKSDADVTLNGLFSLALTSFTDVSHYAFDLSFTGFSAADGAVATVFIDGKLTVSRAGIGNATVHSDSLTLASQGAAGKHGFTAKALDVSLQATVDQITENLSGNFSSTEFAGRSVQMTTPTPVVTLTADKFPSRGTVLMVGANKSALKIQAIDATQARLSVDADGDGEFESTKLVPWTDLL